MTFFFAFVNKNDGPTIFTYTLLHSIPHLKLTDKNTVKSIFTYVIIDITLLISKFRSSSLKDNSSYFMKEAIVEARLASAHDDVPIGAVIVQNGQIIAKAHNLREANQDTTAHAEIVAIQRACDTLQRWILDDCEMYVTLEPCTMCFGAIVQARIAKIYFGAFDTKTGACGSTQDLACLKDSSINHHSTFIGGMMEEECSTLIKEFFKKKRLEKKKQISFQEEIE